MNQLNKNIKRIQDKLQQQSHLVKSNAVDLVNLTIIVIETVYIYLRIGYVNERIPFWYTNLWGEAMLAPKIYLYLLPVTGLLLFLFGLSLKVVLHGYFVRYLHEVVSTFSTFVNAMLFYSTVKIIFIASAPFPPLIPPLVFSLLVPFLTALFITLVCVPFFINYVSVRDIVTNPKIHQHPGMILQNPSARAGGTFYALVFLLIAVFFIGLPGRLIGFYFAVIMLGVLGFVDDYQNTHQRSVFKALENPLLRLMLLLSAISVLIFSGITITTVSNPFGGIFDLSQVKFQINHFSVQAVVFIFTAFWVAWVINLMSWSNGIDGQYSGIVGIASVFICLLALRFTPLTHSHMQVATMAAISAGIAFGLARYSWYPSRIMWGFGATSAGLVVAVLSILINTKILISVLILLVPFLDATVTFVRRIMQRKSPFKGDRGHLHHLLLDRGWTVPQIARFYWGATLVSGLIGYFGSDKYLLQTVLSVGGVVAFVIVLVNLRTFEKRL